MLILIVIKNLYICAGRHFAKVDILGALNLALSIPFFGSI